MAPRILCIGSVNIDEVYSVPHIVKPGETICTTGKSVVAGGKGANFCVAAARAGAEVHIGAKIGNDGIWIRDLMAQNGVNTDLIIVSDTPTGRAIIQVEQQGSGENSIFLFKGANYTFTKPEIVKMCKRFSKGDWMVIHNETNDVDLAIKLAKEQGMNVLWSPAPMDPRLAGDRSVLSLVDVLVVNETELDYLYNQLSDQQDQVQNIDGRAEFIFNELKPELLILTKGDEGSFAIVKSDDPRDQFSQINVFPAPIPQENIKDTTAAGDTWVGFFLAHLIAYNGFSQDGLPQKDSVMSAMIVANYASGIGITRHGAIPSIPTKKEVDDFMAKERP